MLRLLKEKGKRLMEKKIELGLPMFSSSSINLNQILDVGDADDL